MTRVQAEERRERLWSELQRVRQVLAQDPRVHRLFLFGSLATGEVHEWSDLDLVVIMDTPLGFVDRGLEVRRLVRPGVGTDIVVYTPEEFRRLQQRLFVQEEMLRKGVVVPLRPREEAEEWLAYAEDDLRMARLGLEEGIYNQVCFHAQQCVEKCLKALLAKEGGLVPRTHKVDDLWRALPESAREAFASLQDELLELDQYYTVTRYPDAAGGTRPQGLPGQGHAETALQTAERCWELSRQVVAG
jgi:HEPN domain-containing protein/predicted nucleotidyltransferase